ncbi:MAG: TetR/AcrR family transcriptional regulator [Spirochaetota bacterium]
MTAIDNGKRLQPEKRREQLLVFGRELFANHAFDAVSMDEMANMAGVSKGLLYHYFKGRRGFYLQTVRHVVEGCLQAMRAGEGKDDIAEILRAFAKYCNENAGMYKLIIRGGIGADVEVQAETNRVREYFVSQVLTSEQKKKAKPLEKIALSGWIAFIESATAEWIEQPSISCNKFVELLLAFLATITSNDGKKYNLAI